MAAHAPSSSHSHDAAAASTSASLELPDETHSTMVLQLLEVLPHLSYETASKALAAVDWNVERAVLAHFSEPEPPPLAARGRAHGGDRLNEVHHAANIWWETAGAPHEPGPGTMADEQEQDLRHRVTTMRWLVEGGQQIDEVGGPRHSTALHDACFMLRVPIVRFLLELGADPNAVFHDPRPHDAFMGGTTEGDGVERAPTARASVDDVWHGRQDGDTPLHTVARAHRHRVACGRAGATDAVECVQLLLAAGGSPHAVTPAGRTAAELACAELSETEQCSLCQLESAAAPDAPDAPPGAAARHAAGDASDVEEIRALVASLVDFVGRFHGEEDAGVSGAAGGGDDDAEAWSACSASAHSDAAGWSSGVCDAAFSDDGADGADGADVDGARLLLSPLADWMHRAQDAVPAAGGSLHAATESAWMAPGAPAPSLAASPGVSPAVSPTESPAASRAPSPAVSPAASPAPFRLSLIHI